MKAKQVKVGDRVAFTTADGKHHNIVVRKVRYPSVFLIGDNGQTFEFLPSEEIEVLTDSYTNDEARQLLTGVLETIHGRPLDDAQKVRVEESIAARGRAD